MHASPLSQRVALEQRLAEAKQHRDHYDSLFRETRDMAAERETPQARDATMQAAMRYKGQALVWDREVTSLTAELQAVAAHLPVTAAQCADMDDTHSFSGVLA
jgi:predicted glycosyltransferase